DSAYDFGADPVFQNLAHSNSTAIFTFLMETNTTPALDDESWAMDNFSVFVPEPTNAVPEPSSITLLLSAGIVGLFAARRYRRR
ncbi:MAG: PEP-CTERM sorting domain-containing protein, partial [Planctomycetaceae bacterium]